MNATQLFLSLLTDRGSASTNSQVSIQPAASTTGQDAFRQTFARVMDQQDRSAAASQTRAQAQRPHAQQPQARTQAQPQERTPAATDSAAAATQSQDAPRNAELKCSGATEASQARQAQATDQTAAQTQAAQDAATVEDKFRALVDELALKAEQAAEDGAMDEQMKELILDLLALLLVGRNEGQDLKALAQNLGIEDLGDVDGLTLQFFMDKDSELYKLVSMLLNDESALDPEMLDQIKLLVKLAGDKAVQVAVSELTGKADGKDGSTTMLSLTFGADDQAADADQVSVTLRLTPEGVQNAEIVTMSDGQAPATEAALLVPADLFTEEELKALATQQAKTTDAAPAEKATRILVQNTDQAAKPQVLIPMAGTVLDAARPEVLTANAMLLNSDKFLQQLDLQALAQEIASMSKPREELAARFESLLGSKSQAQSVALLTLAGADGGFDFLKDFMNRFGQDAESGNQKWQADVFQNQVKAQLNGERAALTAPAMDTSGAERIAFLGRTDSAPTLFQQAAQQAADSSRPSSTNAQLQQNVMAQVVDRIAFANYNAQGGEIRIGLRPEHLGDLQLKIKIDQDVVVAKFVAQSNEVKAIIESNLGQLKDALAQAGIKVGRFEVSVNTGAQHQGNPEAGHGNGGYTAPAYTEPAAVATDPAAAEYPMLADDVIYSMRPFANAASRYSYLA